ncbi:MAG: 5'-nucleotidase, partial [Pseudomonadota bacterium]
MAYSLDTRLVVGVATSALFDLREAHAVYAAEGLEAFRAHQRARLEAPLEPGVAFAFVKRLLGLNAARPDDPLVEVMLLSRNDAETGRRAFRSVAAHGLPIERAAFLHGEGPQSYLDAFACELFLSSNEADVRAAIAAGAPAGLVLEPSIADDDGDPELRVAFDFDGVLVDDAS